MKKQPEDKTTIKVGEINKFCKESSNTIGTIYHIIGKFDLESKIKVLGNLKTRGFKIVQLLVTLIVIPFFRIRIDNVNQKERGQKHSKAKKDAYYDLKNNELIDWRLVLKLLRQQFGILTQSDKANENGKTTAFIADDTTVMKTGYKIENISKVHDHTINGYLLGFKILVLGRFDGISFIPVDFSIHREKGRGSDQEKKRLKKATEKLKQTKEEYKVKEQEFKDKKKEAKSLSKIQKQTGETSKKQLQQMQKKITRLESQLKKIKNRITAQQADYQKSKLEYIQSQKQYPVFGLKPKTRKEQFKKKRIKNSPGYKRAQEVDSKKTDTLLQMLQRAVKTGLWAHYFIADSWFFSAKMVQGLRNLAKEMHYMGMAPQRENILYGYDDKMVDSKYIYKKNRKKARRCRKYHSHYIQINVDFAGAPLQLFFVKLGRTKNWKLLVTTDITLDFIKIFELYQIRWSIEVFFKESKQYLGLGKCQSQDFDAQICSTTLTMIQYILLCYYKRIHYQQKIDGLFEEISYQTMEASIVEKLIAQFIELLDIIAEMAGIEPLELYMMLIGNPKATEILKELKLDKFLELKNAV